MLSLLFAVLLLSYTLSILFTLEVHKHPTHTEYGVRVCGGALVIGMGKYTVRIV